MDWVHLHSSSIPISFDNSVEMTTTNQQTVTSFRTGKACRWGPFCQLALIWCSTAVKKLQSLYAPKINALRTLSLGNFSTLRTQHFFSKDSDCIRLQMSRRYTSKKTTLEAVAWCFFDQVTYTSDNACDITNQLKDIRRPYMVVGDDILKQVWYTLGTQIRVPIEVRLLVRNLLPVIRSIFNEEQLFIFCKHSLLHCLSWMRAVKEA